MTSDRTVELTTAGARAGSVLAEPVLAAIAAQAAGSVAGVVRLEPGLLGLAGSVVRTARQRIKGLNPAPTEGVRVVTGDGTLTLEIDVIISGQDQAAAVAQAVQRRVHRAVAEATGIAPDAVTVSILDILLPVTPA